MATAPTYEETKRAVLDAVATFNRRAGEIVSWPDLQRQLSDRFRDKEFEDAINGMIAEGLITHEASSKFIKLTNAGYAQM